MLLLERAWRALCGRGEGQAGNGGGHMTPFVDCVARTAGGSMQHMELAAIL